MAPVRASSWPHSGPAHIEDRSATSRPVTARGGHRGPVRQDSRLQVPGPAADRPALQRALAVETLALPESVVAALTPPSTEYARGPEYFATQTGPIFDEAAATAAATAIVVQYAFAPQRLNRLAWQHARDVANPAPRDLFDALVAASWRDTGSDHALVRRTRNWVLLDAALNLLAEGQLHATVDADWRARLRAFADELAAQPAANADAREAARLIQRYLDAPETVKLRPLPVPAAVGRSLVPLS